MSKEKWTERLKKRWKLQSVSEVGVVLLVFALTGTTVLLLKKPVVAYFLPEGGSVWFSVLYYILILPIYNIILLFYGFIFGKFRFFWEFEKRMFQRFRKSDKNSKA